MNARATASDRPSSRQGIALVIVLGFLSVLVVMGVGFAIAMRTERMAAKNFADVVRARMHVQTGLARTMSDIDLFMNAPPALVYPNWLAYGSTSTPFVIGPQDLIAGSATGFVPNALQAEATGAVSSVGWVDIVDAQDSVLRGRFASLALNCSGMLDANTIGPTHDEDTNSNTFTVNATGLPELGAMSIDYFTNSRSKTWVRLESIPEMKVLVSTLMGSNVFPFSRFPPEKRWDLATTSWLDQVDIGLDTAGLSAQQGVIKQIFTQCGIPNEQEVYNNLVDYVDTNDVPYSVDSFCTEAVPMVNEVVVSNRVYYDGAGGRYVHDVWFTVETWYPFPGNKSAEIVAPGKIAYGRLGSFSRPVELLPMGSADLVSASPASVSHTPYSFRTTTFQYTKSTPTNLGAFGALGMELRPDEAIKVQVGGQLVDAGSLTSLPFNVYQLGVSLAGLGSGIAAARFGQPRSASVGDPRLNHLIQEGSVGSDNGGWARENPITLGITNVRTSAGTAMLNGEGVSEMYVRNGPLLSAAELGFLSVGDPWRTIALYGSKKSGNKPVLNPVLEHFRIGPLPTNSARGKVNLNATTNAVLTLPFLSVPIERYPEEEQVSPVYHTDKQDALALATALETARGGGVTNVSIIGLITNAFSANGNLMVQLSTDARKESLIRNSYEYLSARQNLFTIFVAAQDVNDFNGDKLVQNTEVTAEQRAVAVVWRDPLPNVNGHHVSYVRFFKWLNE